MHGNGRAAPVAHRIQQQGQPQHMIEVAVGQEYVIDRSQLLERKPCNAGPGIDQDVIVQQKTGGVPATANAAGATQYSQLHSYFVV